MGKSNLQHVWNNDWRAALVHFSKVCRRVRWRRFTWPSYIPAYHRDAFVHDRCLHHDLQRVRMLLPEDLLFPASTAPADVDATCCDWAARGRSGWTGSGWTASGDASAGKGHKQLRNGCASPGH